MPASPALSTLTPALSLEGRGGSLPMAAATKRVLTSGEESL
jgi:hypothetical protein